GLIHTDDPVKAEAVLTSLFPPTAWTRVSDTLILHGRRICGPTPRCELCHARTLCPHAVTGTRRTRSSAGGRAAGPRRAAPARRRPPR
ncbi:MAG: hypothetical protein R2708_29445, partial [Vicinamibacterales bacterium]